MSATILSPTTNADGGSTLSSAFAWGLDAVIQAHCVIPGVAPTNACAATLLLSSDGNTYVAAATRLFDLTSPSSLSFALAEWADKKFNQAITWYDSSGNLTPGGGTRTFTPLWTSWKLRFAGNIGAAVTVSAVGDSGALSGGGGGGGSGGKVGGWLQATNVAMTAGSSQWPAVIAPFAGTISAVQVVAITNGAGGGFSIQINKNGSPIFGSAQVIAASTTTVQSFTPSTTSFNKGDLFTLTTSSVGTGVEGVTIQIAD
jgi:hypothetical protein